MRKNYSSLKNIIGGFVLGTMLLINTNVPLFAAPILDFAAVGDREVPKPYFQNMHGTFVAELTDYHISTENFVKNLNDYFELDQNHHFELVREVRDAQTGFVHYSYQHFYKQLKIEGNVVFVHAKGEKVNSVNGQLLSQTNFDTTPVISDEKATEAALKMLEGEGKRTAGTTELLIAKIAEGERMK